MKPHLTVKMRTFLLLVQTVTVLITSASEFKLLASDRTPAHQSRYGYSVAVSDSYNGEILVIGAPHDGTLDDELFRSGAVYVYRRDDDKNNTWVETQKLMATDGQDNAQFGSAIAMDENGILVVGAPRHDNDSSSSSSDSGAVYVFLPDSHDGLYREQQRLVPSQGSTNGYFGAAVAISNATIVIGAHGDDVDSAPDAGTAFVYTRMLDTTNTDNTNTALWVEQQRLLANDPSSGDYFGRAVAIAGNSIAVGTHLWDLPSATDIGCVYVFVRNNQNAWVQRQILTARDAGRQDEFGISLSMNRDTLVVGAYKDDIQGTDQGSAYVFVQNLNNRWNEQQKLLAPDSASFDIFGQSVAVSENIIAVGAYREEQQGLDRGAVYVFERTGTVWNFQQKVWASDANNDDLFGYAVALSGTTLVVGAYGDNRLYNGQAYVYSVSLPSTPSPTTLVPTASPTTLFPSISPVTVSPTDLPTVLPLLSPIVAPTVVPTVIPTTAPTFSLTITTRPTTAPPAFFTTARPSTPESSAVFSTHPPTQSVTIGSLSRRPETRTPTSTFATPSALETSAARPDLNVSGSFLCSLILLAAAIVA